MLVPGLFFKRFFETIKPKIIPINFWNQQVIKFLKPVPYRSFLNHCHREPFWTDSHINQMLAAKIRALWGGPAVGGVAPYDEKLADIQKTVSIAEDLKYKILPILRNVSDCSKQNIQEVFCGDWRWLELVQGCVRWRVVVLIALNFRELLRTSSLIN